MSILYKIHTYDKHRDKNTSIIPQSIVQGETDYARELIPPHKKHKHGVSFRPVARSAMASVADKGTKALQKHRGSIHGLWDTMGYPKVDGSSPFILENVIKTYQNAMMLGYPLQNSCRACVTTR